MGNTAQADADFGAVAAAENASVLNQENLHAAANGCQRHTGTGHPAPCDDQVIGFLRPYRFCLAVYSTHLLDIFCIRRRFFCAVCDQNGVTAAVETGHIVQRQGSGSFFQQHAAGILPVPCFPVGSQYNRQCTVVYGKLEFPGTASAVPAGSPVTGTNPDVIGAVLRYSKGGFGVFHGDPHAMCHNICGTHMGDRLCFNDPAAQILETFCFDPDIDHIYFLPILRFCAEMDKMHLYCISLFRKMQ